MKIVLFGLIIPVTVNISFAQAIVWKNVTHKGLSSISGLFQKFEAEITTSKFPMREPDNQSPQ